MLKAIGERSREIIASDNLNYLKGEEKVVYVCFLPEINGEEENFLIKNRNNFIIFILPMGDPSLSKVKESLEILNRMSRRDSFIVLREDVIDKFPYFSLKKIVETRNHLIYLFHEAFLVDYQNLIGKVLKGIGYGIIRYSPDQALEDARRSPWYVAGNEIVYSFSKYNFGHNVGIDLNEILVVTY